MKFIITGGCGFVGRNVLDYLFEQSISPRNIKIIDNQSVCSKDDLSQLFDIEETEGEWYKGSSEKMTFVSGDVRNTALMDQAIAEANVIIHLAGSTGVVPALKDPMEDCTSNVIGTLNILEAARKNNIKRIVYASSGAPLGDANPPIHEQTLPNPISPYGASKLACEGYCRAYANCFGLETVILRFGNLYGPHSTHKISVVANFINQVLKGAPLEIHGEGTTIRDYLFAPDLARAIWLASTTKEVDLAGQIVQVATGLGMTVNQIAENILAVFSEYGYDNIQIQNASPRGSDIKISYADIGKAQKKLGWQFNTELKNGIRKTIRYYLQIS